MLGSEAFARRLRQELKGNVREQKELRELARPATWKHIVQAIEHEKGARWPDFVDRYGD